MAERERGGVSVMAEREREREGPCSIGQGERRTERHHIPAINNVSPLIGEYRVIINNYDI